MDSVLLLDNTRRLNAILHKQNSGKVVFNDICEVMSDVLAANVRVFSRKGKLLGIGNREDIEGLSTYNIPNVGEFIDSNLNSRLNRILSTKENVNLQTLGFTAEESHTHQAIITPIDIAGERFGNLLIYKMDPHCERTSADERIYDDFSIGDIILCEYGATVVGMEILRAESQETAEESRRVHAAGTAVATLSSSEREAIVHVFEELSGCEGVLVASRVADRAGITRSVIVNALRKLESAEIIESKSAGMKGTYIKIVNPLIFDELEELSSEYKNRI